MISGTSHPDRTTRLLRSLCILVVTVAVLDAPAESQPVLKGFLELTEIRKGQETRLHISLENPSSEPITISSVELIPGGFTLLDHSPVAPIVLTPLSPVALTFKLRSAAVGETTVGVKVAWSTSKGGGTSTAAIGQARINESRLVELLGGVILLTLLSLVANYALNRKKAQWDAQAAAAAKRDEVVRRMIDRVHSLTQSHYQRIASWAYTFDEEAGVVLRGEVKSAQRAAYLCYVLARFLRLEHEMLESVGGYFLGDMVAESLLAYISNESDQYLIGPGLLDDGGYSSFVGSMGEEKFFREFENLLQRDERAKHTFEVFAAVIAIRSHLEGLQRLLRLKWKLLDAHIADTYRSWYPRIITPRFSPEDLQTLTALLEKMVSDEELDPPDAEAYKSKIQNFARERGVKVSTPP